MGNGYSMKARANEAEVYIYEDVGEGWFGGVSAKQFTIDLKALGAVETINLHINSFGGEVFEGVAIYRALVDHPAKVISHIDGVAASIASVIAMAGDEIRITEAGMMMIHEASGGVFGRSSDMRKIADLLDTITNTIADVYEARTQQDRDAILAWMAEEKWFTAAEAVELLFADTVSENLRIAAHAPPTARHGFRNTPVQLTTVSAAAAQAATDLVAALAAPAAPAQLTPAPVAAQASPLATRVALQRAQLAAHQAKRNAA